MGAAIELEKLVNKKQLSELTGLSERSIQNLKDNHGLPFQKIGRFVYFYPSEIVIWIKQRKCINK